MSSDWTYSSSFWTREEDHAFENALAIYSTDSNLWEKIAAAVPGRTFEEIEHHFEVLVSDVNAIESGLVPLPSYADSFNKSRKHVDRAAVNRQGKQSGKDKCESSSQSATTCKRGKPWSAEEHRLFLQGLDKYGRGDWRSISRLCVESRTPSQVASHAQKFFKRLDAADTDKKRSSIHDITTLDDGRKFYKGMDVVDKGKKKLSICDATTLDNGKKVSKRKTAVDKGKKKLSIHDVTTLDEGKLLAQQVPIAQLVPGVAGSCLMDSGLYPSAHTVGDDDMFYSLIDSQCNIFSHVPSIEAMSGEIDLFESLFNLEDISIPPGPSSQHSNEPTGVSSCAPLIATQHIPTPEELMAEEMIASADVDFCNPLFTGQHDMSNHQGFMTQEVIGTAEGAHTLNFGESSFPVHPDFGAYAPPTASQPTLEPGTSGVNLPGLFPTPWSLMFGFDPADYAAFLCDAPDDMAPLTTRMPPPDQN